jgi:hypothetical protein
MKMRTLRIVIALFLIAVPALAPADDSNRSLEGGHHGKVVEGDYGGKQADLVLMPIPGRGRSFIGALVIDERHTFVYQVDFNLSKGDWVMIPINATSDGEVIAANDTNPTLTLSKTLDRHQEPVLEINNANSPNREGFNGVVDFPQHDWWHSEYQWQTLKEGVYKVLRDDGSATIMAPLLEEKHEATATMRMRGLTGQYRMRLKAPGVFALNAWSERDTGSEQAAMPARLAISVRKSFHDRVILINPTGDGHDEVLERK